MLLLTGFGVSLGIEIVQLLVSGLLGFTYKIFDVDDLILNLIGTASGWTAWRIWSTAFGSDVQEAFNDGPSGRIETDAAT